MSCSRLFRPGHFDHGFSEGVEAEGKERALQPAMGFVPGWFYPVKPEAGFVGEAKCDCQHAHQRRNFRGAVICVSSNPRPRVFKAENSVSMPQRLRYTGTAVLILMPLATTISVSPVFNCIMAIFIGVVAFDEFRPRYHVPSRMRLWRFLGRVFPKYIQKVIGPYLSVESSV